MYTSDVINDMLLITINASLKKLNNWSNIYNSQLGIEVASKWHQAVCKATPTKIPTLP
jgi:hypothetical protein